MPKSKKSVQRENAVENEITPTARNILSAVGEISHEAEASLNTPDADISTVLAAGNTLNNARAMQTLGAVAEERRAGLLQALKEPAIARVVVKTADGTLRTLYFLRATPPKSSAAGASLASLRSPTGRLAALPIGDSISLGSQTYEVVERATIRPERASDDWDSINTTFEADGYGPISITSLRALLNLSDTSVDDDPLEALLAEGRERDVVYEGIRRNVLTKMGLRDQPLLDQYQDEIFRLSLAARIAILGPPGSGKTTTLIKRLGLKLDWAYLADDERALVLQSLAKPEGHRQSWLMFTPTELLKQYVKEAFAREGIPASDERIHTWADFRHDLARNSLRFLRTANSRAGFVLEEEARTISGDTPLHQIEWADDFFDWRIADFWDRLSENASLLVNSENPQAASLGTALADAIELRNLEDRFTAIGVLDAPLRDIVARFGAEIDEITRKALSRYLRADNTLLDSLLAFISTLDDDEDADDADSEEEDEPSAPTRGREAAFEAYKQAARAQARAAVSRRQIGPSTRAGRLLAWLGERVLTSEEARAVGDRLLVQSSSRAFMNSVRTFVFGAPRQYRRYRRDRGARWYRESSTLGAALAPLEADLLILATLKAARVLFRNSRIVSDLDQQRNSSLRVIADILRNQVLVDEATDFGPIQLACMEALSDPSTNAFVACGDFNQRITPWGARSVEDLQWAVPKIAVSTINISYRHTLELNGLAREIVLLSDPQAVPVKLPENVDNTGVPPVLGTGLSNQNDICFWLFSRISEIERHTREFPSVAILVSCEEDVQPIALKLDRLLKGINLRAVACPNGQVVGRDSDVRVFDVQHIKGLEFEAVFFVDLDRLAATIPDLFDKFLYVGTTRAATYLGLTVAESALPEKIASLGRLFTASWLN